MQLFAPQEKSPWLPSVNSMGALAMWLKREFLRKKLQTPFGYLLLVSLAYGIAWSVGSFGWQAGAILLVALFVMPILFGAMFHMRFGVYFITGAAFCVMGLKRLTGGEISFGLILDACLLFMAFGLMLKQIERRDWSPAVHPFTILILGWTVYNLIELINPLAPSQMAWLYVVRDMAARMYLFFIVLFSFSRIEHFQQLLHIWLTFATVVAGYAIVQEVVGLQAFEQDWLDNQTYRLEKISLSGWVRKFSILGDPSSLGLVMGYSSVAAIIMLFFPKRTIWQKGWLILSIGLMLTAMVLSGTRTAFIALPATLAFIGILSLNRRVMLGFGLVVCLGIGLFLVPGKDMILHRYRSTFQPTQTTSVAELLQNQAYAKKLIQQYAIGQGLGTTGARGQQFSPYTLLSRFPSHSGYLQIGLEMGWIGLLLYCSMMFVILMVGVRSYFRAKSSLAKWYLLLFNAVIFFLIISNYSQKSLISLPSSLIFPTCLAGLVLVKRWDEAGGFEEEDEEQKLPAVEAT